MSKLMKFTFKLLDLMVIFALTFGSPMSALAAVWTDQADYSPGSIVTINGDNSDGAGYLPGETVHVDVAGPNGYAAACEGVAGDTGAWSCQVTLWDSLLAVGTYTYIATGLASGVSETGTFTDAAGDFTIDFVGAAPYSYNHLVGGGAFDDRTVGKNADIVESLEAIDFACGDTVTFLAQVVVDDTARAATDGPQTIELDFQFLLDTTGATGVAIGDITYVGVNYAPIVDLIAGEDNIDQGNIDDGGSVATLKDEWYADKEGDREGTPGYTGGMFVAGSTLNGTVEVTDLERNEEVIIRVDTRLYCKPGSDPTGNLQGAITAGRLTYIQGTVPVTPPANISVGNQTVPFLQFGNLHWPELDIQKTVTTSGGTCPGIESINISSGDTVKYCYKVTNPSNTTNPPGASLFNVIVVDDNRTPADTSDDFYVTLTGLTDIDIDGQMDDLAAGGIAYGEALVTITGALGTYTNTATTKGFTFPTDTNLPLTDTDTASVVINFVPAPAISINKTTNGSDGPTILYGQAVNWSYVVKNTGNVALTNISVSDDQGVTVSCPKTALAVGEQMTCTASGTAVAGNYKNIGTAEGYYGTTKVTASDPSSYFGANPKIDVEKYVSVDNGTTWLDADTLATAPSVSEGSTVQFKFTVTNTGNVDLSPVTLSDSDFDLTACPMTDSLAVGASFDCTISKTFADPVNHDDLATTKGTYAGIEYTDTDPAYVTITDVMPSITLTKTASPATLAEPGGTFTYTYTIHNNSSEAVKLTKVTDDVLGTLYDWADPMTVVWIAPGADYLLPGTFTKDYSDADSYTNIAWAHAVDNEGNPASDDDTRTVTVTDVAPDISITKTASPTHVPETGGNVTFTFVVTNDGVEDVTITSLNDTIFGDLNGQGDCVTGGLILVDGSYTCSITKFLSSDSITAHYNVVTAVGTDDDGTTDTATDDETVTFDDVAPAILITKTASPTSVPETGGDVTFTFLVENTGMEDVTLTSLTDTVFGDLNGKGTCVVPQTILIGGSYSCSVTVALSSDSLTAHTNVVTATAVDDDNTPATDTDDETVTFTDVAPAIRITKTASPTSVPETGGDVTFTFLVENIGMEDVTLTTLDDTVFGDLNGKGTCVVPQTILVGASYSCTYTTTLSSDSLTAHTNVVTATAVDDDNTPATDTDDETVTFTDVAPAIRITKTASPTHVLETGDDVTFTFLVENIGMEDVTLTSLTDTKFGDLNGQGTCSVPQAIAVGTSYTCTVTKFLASDSLTAHYNVVTAVGTDDDGTTDTATDDETVTFDDLAPVISITKTASPTSVPETGGNVTFTFLVENTGMEDVTLTSLTDTVFGDLNGQGTCVTGGLILVGGSYSCSVTVFLASDSLTAHTNVVTAVGTDDDGTTDTATDNETVTFDDVMPDIQITKTANPTHVDETGGNVTFTFLVENIGMEDVTLTTLDDTKFGDLDGKGTCVVPQTILIGGSYTCEYTVFLASDSLTAHTNVVTATAVDDDNTPATDWDDETVTFDDVAPAIRITKTASPTSVPETGGNVTFTFLVENIGMEDVTLTSLVDTKFGDLDGKGTCDVPQTILIGGSYSCTYTVSLASDSLTAHYNVVTATAVDDDNTPATDDDDETVTFDDVAPAIRITKTASPTSVPETGGNVEFTIVVTNNSLEDATIDSLVDSDFDLAAHCPDAVGTVLGYLDTYTCTFTEFISGDYESGISHENTATVTASDDDGNTDTASDDATVTFTDLTAEIDVEKYVSVDGGTTWDAADSPMGPYALEGAAVQFKFVVKNIGTAPLTNVTLTDSDFLLTGCTIPATLAVGGSFDCIITTTAVLGQHVDTATAYGDFTDGAGIKETDNDTDDANYFGMPKIRVLKTVNQQPFSGPALTFEIRKDAAPVNGQVGTIRETKVASVENNGQVVFDELYLPGDYQLCEIIPTGYVPSYIWGTYGIEWFKPGYAPGQGGLDPTILVCVNFTIGTDGTLNFQNGQQIVPPGDSIDIDNQVGQMPRTIGYWKNHSSASGSNGGQDPVLDQMLYKLTQSGHTLQIGTLMLPGGTTPDNAGKAAQNAVQLLNKSTLAGKKMASDPCFNLAAQLVAYRLNQPFGAWPNNVAASAADEAQKMLLAEAFNGTTHSKLSAKAVANLNYLAAVLDAYNNSTLTITQLALPYPGVLK